MTKTILIALNCVWAAIMAPLFFLLVVVPATILAFPFPPRIRLALISPFWLGFGQFLIRIVCWSSIYREDHRQKELRTYPPVGLYISNHQSYMDIPLMLSQYQVLPIMKKEVVYIPVFGLVAWAAGALVVSRDKHNSRKKVLIAAKQRLTDDKFSLQYYPEGTRSRDGIPKPFSLIKTTLIYVAFENNVPLIPLSMYGTNRILNSRGMINPGQSLGIITHAALFPKDFATPDEFAQAAWEKVLKGHSDLSQRLATPQS